MNYFKLVIILFVLNITACTKGHLEYISLDGTLKTACETEYTFAPSVDKYAVEYVLVYCAHKAKAKGFKLVDSSLLSIDTTLPVTPNGELWSHHLAKTLHNKGKINDREFGYVLASLDLPQNSSIALDNNENLKVTLLTDNVYQHVSYKEIEPWGLVGASGLIVVDGKNAHIIDTPWTQKETEQLIKWIKSKGLIVKSSVVTHFHEDASGGIPFLNKSKIKTYATPLTNNLLNLKHRQKSSDDISSNTFVLVKDTIEIFYPGAGHTEDNIVVWLPKSNILFGGCFIKSMKSKNLGNTEDASVKDWPESIQKVINKYPNIEIVVPGHGEVGDINLLRHTTKLALGEPISG